MELRTVNIDDINTVVCPESTKTRMIANMVKDFRENNLEVAEIVAYLDEYYSVGKADAAIRVILKKYVPDNSIRVVKRGEHLYLATAQAYYKYFRGHGHK